MLSTGEEIRSPQQSSRSGPILAKMPCTIGTECILFAFEFRAGLAIQLSVKMVLITLIGLNYPLISGKINF